MTRRILHAVASAGDTCGGVSAAIASLGAVESAAGHDATLVTLYRPEQGITLLSGLPRWYDVELVRPGRLAGRFHGGSRLTEALRRLVPQHDLVVLHGVFDLASVVGGRTARRFGVPYLLWPHGSLDPYDLRKHSWAKHKLAFLWRESLDGAAALMCTSQREADRLETFGATTRRLVLPLPLPDDVQPLDRREARRRCQLPADARIVLFLGRIDAKKGLLPLLSGFARAAQPEDLLVIAGSGNPKLTAQLRRQADELRCRVIFTGWVDGARSRELLAAADVFALISDNENFAVAVAEAAQAGVATLISDEVYLGDELVPAGASAVCGRSPDLVARALRELLADPHRRRRMGAAGRAWARANLQVSAVAETYLELVGEVMRECRASVY
ncbi:glycosyltransferase involved in cell wall biosynthesis [Lentzea atacamensis]|uniref:Glycosyltransferase involved in cell wall biosynthesis n=1 Tax=Lentzea atacamensis TaxID=531938 RepID=A0ABX9E0E5_9PSEU|nr:glycosyltransferase [Lentzea atacamensis]RAS60642.1 glycosyltransferase involved in cell wall biosynthesis [Lentzea atacamensis]